MPESCPLGGTVFDTDNSQLAGATVVVQNLRTLDKVSATTETDGSYAFDLGNEDDFPNGYEVGDILILYARKIISVMAEKFTQDTEVVSGAPMTKNLTVSLYINKDSYPLSNLDKRDSEMRMFEPTARARRVLVVDEDGDVKEFLKIGNNLTYVEADIVNNKILMYINGTKVQEFG